MRTTDAKIAKECDGCAQPPPGLDCKDAKALKPTPFEGASSEHQFAEVVCPRFREGAVSALITSDAGPADAEPATGASKRPVEENTAAVPKPEKPHLRGAGVNRALQQLRQLLDFYFEPFTFQHNRFLLDLATKAIGAPARKGPWVIQELFGFCCTVEDLKGLGRVATALSKVQYSCDLTQELQGLRHVNVASDGRLQLRMPPEVRTFVHAEGAEGERAGEAVKYVTASREQAVSSPKGVIIVVSCTMGSALHTGADNRAARLKRQLLVFRADVICLQGFDPRAGQDGGLTSAFADEGYEHAVAHSSNLAEANTIFWHKERVWNRSTQRHGPAISVLLQPYEAGAPAVRVLCFRPEVPRLSTPSLLPLLATEASEQGLWRTSSEPAGPVVVCADCTTIGGAECVSIVEELALLESVAQEVFGEELAAPMFGHSAEGPILAKNRANNMNRLSRHDAMLFGGLTPLAALSGHTEGYLAMLSDEDAFQQFPALRMPLVAAFDCTSTPADAHADAQKPTRKVHRL